MHATMEERMIILDANLRELWVAAVAFACTAWDRAPRGSFVLLPLLRFADETLNRHQPNSDGSKISAATVAPSFLQVRDVFAN